MDGVLLNAKVYAGFAKAAKRVGIPYDIYRPALVPGWESLPPISPINKIGTLPAAFTIHSAKNFEFGKPSDYKDPQFHALIDPTTLQLGDYIVAQTGVAGPFFVAELTPAMPPLVIQTNRTITVYTPGPAMVAGANGYGGSTLGNEVAMMTQWPASMLLGSRGVRDQQLPGDAGYGSFRILLPVLAGANIRPGTIIMDDLGNRCIVVAAELQDLGWRIDATQVIS